MSILYSITKILDMPLIMRFFTCWRINLSSLLFLSVLTSCGSLHWHSIEQTPAEPVAYMRDGIYMSGAYVRSARVSEVDGRKVVKLENNLIELSVAKHQIKIYCDEAEGKFNSNEFNGEAKTLELDAKIQRTYLVRCMPYSHWWIEDSENNAVVAGEKF